MFIVYKEKGSLSRVANKKHSEVGTENEHDEWIGGTFDDTDAIVLHRFYEKHLDKVGKELLSHAKPTVEGEANTSRGKKAWDTLCATLVDMGPPIDVPQLNMLNSVESPEYINFLDRNEQRDGRSVKDLLDIHIPAKVFAHSLFWKFYQRLLGSNSLSGDITLEI